MEEYNYYDILCDSISSLRKQKEMTQEQVAGQLGISKWESKLLVRILVCCRRLPGCLIRRSTACLAFKQSQCSRR